MKRSFHKLEVIVDKAITPCLIVLLAIIIIELGFKGLEEHYQLGLAIEIADYAVISVFILDLIFKYMHVRHIPLFVRKYWLDIIAVFPFFLLFRFFEFTIGAFSTALSEGAQTAQTIVHEGLELEKEGSKLLREAEAISKEGSKLAKEAGEVSKLSRSARFMRFLRPVLRLPRFMKAVPKTVMFYEKPTGEHHRHEFRPRHR